MYQHYDRSTCNSPDACSDRTQSMSNTEMADTGAGGKVMPLHAFSKLFLRHVTTDRTPTGLRPTRTHLTAYNGSPIKQYGKLDIAIDWKPEGAITGPWILEVDKIHAFLRKSWVFTGSVDE